MSSLTVVLIMFTIVVSPILIGFEFKEKKALLVLKTFSERDSYKLFLLLRVFVNLINRYGFGEGKGFLYAGLSGVFGI